MRKFFGIVLIIVLLASFSVNGYTLAETDTNSGQDSGQTKKVQLEELQTQNKDLQSQIEENTNQLGIVKEELTNNLIKIQEADEEIAKSEEKLQELNEEIAKLDTEINDLEKKIQQKQKEYNKEKDLADEKLLTVCEKGKMQYIEVLLGARNIVEFLSKVSLVEEICKNDVQLLENVNNQKQELEEESAKLEDEKNIIKEKRKTQQREAQLLENTKTARKIEIARLSEEELNIQLKIDEYKAQVEEVENEIRKLAGIQAFGEDYVGEKMIWPIPGYTTITSPFGMRLHPITGLYRLHRGTDVGAPIGANFVAMASGVVTKAGYNSSYGNMVIIDHGGGVQTLYAHGSEIVAQLGQLIAQGETVLKVGSTGDSTGPHAHFEIRINGEAVDALNYVEPE